MLVVICFVVFFVVFFVFLSVNHICDSSLTSPETGTQKLDVAFSVTFF